jgi:hypothetical protein
MNRECVAHLVYIPGEEAPLTNDDQNGLNRSTKSILVIQPVFEPDVFRIHAQNYTATTVRY